MLSDRERRVLAMIEEGLRADEGRFVDALHATTARRDPRQHRWAVRALAGFGVLLVVLGMVTDSGGLIMQGLLFGTAGVAWSRWRSRRAEMERTGDPGPLSTRARQTPPGWFRSA